MNYQQLTQQAEEFVTKYITEYNSSVLPFHNLSYIKNVASIVSQMAQHFKLSDEEFSAVAVAAWFLHTGYYKNPLQPEQASAELAEEFLKSSGIEEATINSVGKCIHSLKSPQPPGTLLEKIICDADSFYIGAEDFSAYNKSKRKEFELLNNTDVSKGDWRKSTIDLFERHQYHTDYSKQFLDASKAANLEKLKKKETEANEPVNPIITLLENNIKAELEEEKEEKKEKKEKKKKKEKNSKEPARTIETMFRTTSTNSQRLSNQADAKAHILISVNAIVISVLLSVLVRRLDEYSYLTIPAALLLIVNLVTIIFSILATRPNVPKGIIRDEDLQANKVNLLFFGNFFRLKFDKYSEEMLRMMESKNFLYLNLLRNLHEQGRVLSKKYRMLKTAYNIFMYGLVVSVVAFFIARFLKDLL